MKNNKYTTRKGLDRLGRYRQYFLAGHGRWFVTIMGLSTFSLIFYNFMWINLGFVPDTLKNEFLFLMLFFSFYFPFATIFGYLDLTRGTFKAETNVSLEVNPIWKRLFLELTEIKKDLEELKKEKD